MSNVRRLQARKRAKGKRRGSRVSVGERAIVAAALIEAGRHLEEAADRMLAMGRGVDALEAGDLDAARQDVSSENFRAASEHVTRASAILQTAVKPLLARKG